MKTKKGFTLIALLIVASIFGLSALIGLRFYTGNQLSPFNSLPPLCHSRESGNPSFFFLLPLFFSGANPAPPSSRSILSAPLQNAGNNTPCSADLSW